MIDMKEEEVHSIFDQFETDEETGEVIIPRATVGVVTDTPAETDAGSAAADASSDGDAVAVGAAGALAGALDGEELPELHFDFNFTEEDLVEVKPDAEEDEILQSIDAALAQEMASAMGSDFEEEEEEKKKNFWTMIPLWCRILMISLGSLLLILALVIGTRPGRRIVYNLVASYISGRVQHPTELTPMPTDVVAQPSVGAQPTTVPDDPIPTIDPQVTIPLVTPAPIGEPRHEEYCYNVLLIGEEAMHVGQRSDSMILLSVNKKDKKIHMTSLMRDMYVQIKGYNDAKLNAAYAYGGAPLLIDTIEKSLQVKIDGYVIVGFDNFEWIIDRLGGVEITLSATEANYLNTTRYITKPQYRTVVAGTQLMNGNQALGYCRVRKVPTVSGADSDFGRTERQRKVLTQLFNKYREKNVFTLLGILNDCLPKVRTNISKDDMATLLETVVEERILKLETLRIPVNGSYDGVSVGGVGDVLAVRWPQNIEALHKFIFGTEEDGQE